MVVALEAITSPKLARGLTSSEAETSLTSSETEVEETATGLAGSSAKAEVVNPMAIAKVKRRAQKRLFIIVTFPFIVGLIFGLLLSPILLPYNPKKFRS